MLEPGASFGGAVLADKNFSNTLEFAVGAGDGTIAGLGDAITGFGTIAFDSGVAWFVGGNEAGLATGQTIDGFAFGDTIELTDFVANSGTFGAGGLVLSGTSVSQTIGLQGSFAPGAFDVSNDGSATFIALAAPCFVAGTRIATPRGDVPVEALRPGDMVVVCSAERTTPQPIVWHGRRTVDCRRHPALRSVWPVRVLADAFGDAAPRRDLWLSPDHAVFVEDVLIPIKHLVNGENIAQMAMDDVVILPHRAAAAWRAVGRGLAERILSGHG